jgi:hypothetical protein
MAPAPFTPVVSTPIKLITVIEESTLCESVAVTVILVSGTVENACQISDVPSWTLVLRTSVQLKPVEVTFVTVMGVDVPSVAINASSNSLPAVVEKLPVWMFVDAVA